MKESTAKNLAKRLIKQAQHRAMIERHHYAIKVQENNRVPPVPQPPLRVRAAKPDSAPGGAASTGASDGASAGAATTGAATAGVRP